MTCYQNPVARHGDFADPFVLRFDGTYYLYATNLDVRCWTSTDLVDWTPQGPTIEPGTFGDLVPFAPEVVYSNGTFWMYTSPQGTGHRVLRSDRPTGPFVPASENLGRDIDGNVLVDDDGRWYFFWASHEGILGCEMASPVELGEPVHTGAFMHGWTEGPFVEKRDGAYHMTLTGNHYLSPGYRIDAAVSDRPLEGYVGDPLNPVLVSTTGPVVGLGHSSSVLGPDLVSHYIAYHDLKPDRSRDLNIDRQVWNGRSLQVLGPTTTAPVPGAPDASTRWGTPADDVAWTVLAGELTTSPGRAELSGDDAVVLWDAEVGARFTSEHNLALVGDRGRYGVVVRGRDGSGIRLELDAEENTVALLREGRSAGRLVAARLPEGHRHDALHCIRLVHDAGTVTVHVDGRRQLTADVTLDEASRLGYAVAGGSLLLGHTAVTRTVEVEASRRAARPVPGRFWAALTPTPGAEREPVTAPVQYDRLRLDAPGEVTYDVVVARAGRYDVFVTGELDTGTLLTVALGEHAWSAPPCDGSSGVAVVTVDLPAGAHVLRLGCRHGSAAVDTITVEPHVLLPAFTLRAPWSIGGPGKALVGDVRMHDGTVEAIWTAQPSAEGAHTDLLVRASQLAEGGEGDDAALGLDFLLGYSLQVHADRLILARHAYDERVLAQVPGTWDLRAPHHVAVTLSGDAITARVDGTVTLEARDPHPHLVGGAGVRVVGARASVEKFSITH